MVRGEAESAWSMRGSLLNEQKNRRPQLSEVPSRWEVGGGRWEEEDVDGRYRASVCVVRCDGEDSTRLGGACGES